MRVLRWLVGGIVGWRLFGPTLKPRFWPPQQHPWRLEGQTVFVGDEEFLVRQAGPETGPPIVLIHGVAGSSLSEWHQIGQKLATSRRVIMVDHRSHGLSSRTMGGYEVEDAADDIVGVLDAIGVSATDVVGYSMGGAVAQALAHRHPGRVSHLVLIATFASHPGSARRARRVSAVLTRGFERLTGVGTPEVRWAYLLTTGAVAPQHARWFWQENHRREPDSGAEATFALLRFDSRAWVGRLGLETMVVIPTGDWLVPVPWQYELAGLIPEVRLVEIADARHEVVWTHPDRILDELEAFLN